jgi:AraC family transcriptional regulator, activator of mtrCDE
MLLKNLLENLAVNVDPFATCSVARGWRLRLPRRDWVVFHFILQGEGFLRLGTGEVHALRPNLLVVMPPSLPHSIECGTQVSHETGPSGQEKGPICELLAGPPEDVELLVACGRVEVTYGGGLGLFDRMREPLLLGFSGSPQMRRTFETLLEEYAQEGDGTAAMMNALMNQCLILVFRRLGELPESRLPWLSALDDPHLARVMDTILQSPEQPHSLESLAGLAYMSRSVFARRFHEAFDRTPMDYLRDVRLRKAARLLHQESLSVGDVARQVGFASRSHFSRTFRDQYGCSPVKFREGAV